MATPTKSWTDEDLLRLEHEGYKCELVDGEIKMSPAGYRHGRVVMRVALRLATFVEERRLGEIVTDPTGFRLPNGNLRCPDVAFVAKDHIPDGSPVGFFHGAPDLVVEVLSPEDRPREVLDKVGEYLAAGTRLVWIVDPERKRAAVHRSLTEIREIPERGVLEGEDVLPGFSCPLTAIVE